jgi:O-antigen/teichoic acid export membrane protein
MRVSGPLFARVQKDRELVPRYFRIITEFLSLSVFPLLVGLAVVAPDAVRVLLGTKWAAAVEPLRWLAVFTCARTLSTLCGQVLNSLRYTRFNMLVSLLSFAVMPAAFVLASRWGTGAVAASWLILAPVTVVPLIVKLLWSIGMRYRDYGRVLLPSLVGCAIMVAAALAVHLWLGTTHAPAVVRLSLQVAAGGAAYLAFLGIFYRPILDRYFQFLLGLRRADAGLTEAGL